jgi:hypothetical protein
MMPTKRARAHAGTSPRSLPARRSRRTPSVIAVSRAFRRCSQRVRKSGSTRASRAASKKAPSHSGPRDANGRACFCGIVDPPDLESARLPRRTGDTRSVQAWIDPGTPRLRFDRPSPRTDRVAGAMSSRLASALGSASAAERASLHGRRSVGLALTRPASPSCRSPSRPSSAAPWAPA